MDRKTVLWMIIAALFLVVLVVTFKAGAGISGDALTSTASAAQSAASGAMVGGC